MRWEPGYPSGQQGDMTPCGCCVGHGLQDSKERKWGDQFVKQEMMEAEEAEK